LNQPQYSGSIPWYRLAEGRVAAATPEAPFDEPSAL
jgi:hypothetical protein